jgi:hypothetical protein
VAQFMEDRGQLLDVVHIANLYFRCISHHQTQTPDQIFR